MIFNQVQTQFMKITFPDGRIGEFPIGVTALDIAKSISDGLANKVLAVELNGEVKDATRPIEEDANLRLLTWDDQKGKSTFWHSSAHLMAEALEFYYPGVKFWVGPALDNGFYYDIDLGDNSISSDDFKKIEDKMIELAKQNNSYLRKEMAKEDAITYFTNKGDEYKLALLENLSNESITFYTQGNFTDLCRGPHIPRTGYIKAVKLISLAGAYWKGDEKNKQLTRIYGITFPQKSELDKYLQLLEEAKKRDHRKIGKEMEIFIFDDDVGPGLPLWMPNGGIMIEQLERLAKNTEEKAGYHRVKTPHIAKESMYIKSGHLPYYADSMFPPMEMDGVKYYLRAMNCPHHHKIFDAVPRSYKDLPFRVAEYATDYRYEQSGELFGLMRVRSLHMNDGHIYCSEEQFASEFRAVNDMYMKYFKIFGIDKFVMRFSTHDPAKLGKKYLDMPDMWKKTEDMVRKVLVESNIPYVEVPDEAAFYGPKIDVQVYSVIGREFTLATNQVDFGGPIRFKLSFQNKNNENEMPIIIHRAPLGTHERFIGFLIEHYAGNFPTWLAPQQVSILPITDRNIAYSKNVLDILKSKNIRASIDERSERVGKKVRDAEIKKIPYMLIIGDKEEETNELALRKRHESKNENISIENFIQLVKDDCAVVEQ